MKTKLMFMHTMGGKPAYYVPGEQIVFASRSKRMPVQLCSSVAEIQHQRRASRKWRQAEKLGPEVDLMSFVHVEVPVQ